jgi:hypothetical protein
MVLLFTPGPRQSVFSLTGGFDANIEKYEQDESRL